MPFYREGNRIGCGLVPIGPVSAIKKAGLLYRQWCIKCGHRCWIYTGVRYRFIDVRPKLHTD